jgi:hypothetical protein
MSYIEFWRMRGQPETEVGDLMLPRVPGSFNLKVGRMVIQARPNPNIYTGLGHDFDGTVDAAICPDAIKIWPPGRTLDEDKTNTIITGDQ